MSSINRAADSHEIRPLTGIRGFAACLVVLRHFQDSWIALIPGLSALVPLASRGHLGVDLFFILSGFILSYVYNTRDAKLGLADYRRFLWFRLARVYPNHVATLAFLALLVVAARHYGVTLTGDYPLSGLPWQLTMTHAWPYLPGGLWNYPSWSISAEWFAYLFIFPVTWHLLQRGMGAAASLGIGYAALALWLFVLARAPLPPFLSIFRVSCEFLAGAMFFNVHVRAGAIRHACQKGASAVFAVLLAVMCFAPTDSPLAQCATVLLFPLVLLGLTSETSLVSRFFSTAGALWLGRVSYALYMSHAIAQKLLKIALPASRYADASTAMRLGVLFANFLLILLFAAGLYYLVEVPARNVLRRVTTRWTQRASRKVAEPQG